MLENFFIRRNKGELLAHRGAAALEGPVKRHIANTIVDFMAEVFGLHNITRSRKVMTGNAAVILFPFFIYKDSDEDGLVRNASLQNNFWLLASSVYFSGSISR